MKFRLIATTLVGVLVLGSSMAFAQIPRRAHGHLERHPEIRRAMHALQNAKAALMKADRDFDGHRTAAVKEVDEALAECAKCLQADRH